MNWRRASVAALAAVPVIVLFAWGFTRDPAEIPSPLPGRLAPSFALQVFAPGDSPSTHKVGDTIRLADQRGQIVVLNFWASWCGPCAEEHRTLSRLATSYASKPVRFIGVLFNDSTDTASQWIARMGGMTYPSLVDPNARTAIDFGLYGVPETFFLDVSGRVAYKYTGAVTTEMATRVIDSLIAAGRGRTILGSTR